MNRSCLLRDCLFNPKGLQILNETQFIIKLELKFQYSPLNFMKISTSTVEIVLWPNSPVMNQRSNFLLHNWR